MEHNKVAGKIRVSMFDAMQSNKQENIAACID
jgi:hypothetical protein